MKKNISIKTKITLSLLFVFLNLLILGGLGIYFIRVLSEDTKAILKDNYQTVQYTRNMVAIMGDAGFVRSPFSHLQMKKSFEHELQLQLQNITEPGEAKLTHQLEQQYIFFIKDSLRRHEQASLIHATALQIMDLNLKAIAIKSVKAKQTASTAWLMIASITTLSLLITLSFILNIPSYIARPIQELMVGIQELTLKNYDKRVTVTSSDEFGAIASAFNQLAAKTEEYVNSNLTELLNEKKRMDVLADILTDPMIILDEHKKVLFVNQSAVTVLSRPKDTLIGQYVPDLALQNELLHQWMQSTLENTNQSALKKITIVLDGKEYYYLCLAQEIHQTLAQEFEEKLIGYVMYLRDFTTFNEKDTAKTQFIASISHELRTPIASVEMAHRLLTDPRTGNLNDEQVLILGQIEKDVNRLKAVTKELLDLAQVETGNIKLIKQKASVESIVSYAVESMRLQAKEKNILLQINVPVSLPNIHADPEKCAWVLTNLLSNAIRYTPEGGEIQVKVAQKEQMVCFSVKDNGIGIPEQYLNRLFEKYYQVPGSDPNKRGTGLGLAIAKEFIEAQEGTITCESKIGVGSIFSFSLPIWRT